MNKKILKIFARQFLVFLILAALPADGFELCAGETVAAAVAKKKKKRTRRRRKTARKAVVTNLVNNPDSAVWVRRGQKGIIISRDSAGTVRAMAPYSFNPDGAARYAEAVSEYGKLLASDSVRVYSLLVPSQGEYYMPEIAWQDGAEQRTIEHAARLMTDVTPVLVNDTLMNHLDEPIYSRTDHHWAPLGAYYGSKAFADVAGVTFRPLDQYTPVVVKDYVGTMKMYSGDDEIKKYPEDFVYYMPPGGYEARFINYTVSGGVTKSEGEPHEAPFFVSFPDGSGAAYCCFMGGDYCTVKVSGTGGTPGRKLLIVKDSYGNAMASCLFGSFEEVHVIDFRYFPHNLPDYVRDNGITDMVFVNLLSIGLAPTTAERFRLMQTQQ